jgi:hypothetical protein
MQDKNPQPQETLQPPSQPVISTDLSKKKTTWTNWLLVVGIFALLVGITATLYLLKNQNKPAAVVTKTTNSTTPVPTISHNLQDLTKLPLGDKKYSTSPKKGFVYSCQSSFNGSGAFKQGPWINTASNTWDLTKKVARPAR